MSDNNTSNAKTMDTIAREMVNNGLQWLKSSNRRLLVVKNREGADIFRVNLMAALVVAALTTLFAFWALVLAGVGGYMLGLRLDIIGDAAENGNVIEMNRE
ncbi:MAG: hypothetical protein AAF787_14830 [Chloroflexota bacterium]